MLKSVCNFTLYEIKLNLKTDMKPHNIIPYLFLLLSQAGPSSDKISHLWFEGSGKVSSIAVLFWALQGM